MKNPKSEHILQEPSQSDHNFRKQKPILKITMFLGKISGTITIEEK